MTVGYLAISNNPPIFHNTKFSNITMNTKRPPCSILHHYDQSIKFDIDINTIFLDNSNFKIDKTWPFLVFSKIKIILIRLWRCQQSSVKAKPILSQRRASWQGSPRPYKGQWGQSQPMPIPSPCQLNSDSSPCSPSWWVIPCTSLYLFLHECISEISIEITELVS